MLKVSKRWLIAGSGVVAVALAVLLLWLSSSSPKHLHEFDLKIADPITQLPDFASIQPIPERKLAFFSSLLPLVEYENQRVVWQREQLLTAQARLDAGQELTGADLKIINQIVTYYDLDWPLTSKQWQDLKVRVLPVPTDLVLVQAANESAWGTSRFALEGNNLFGQWCFSQGCGLVPSARSAGAKHEVRKFANVLESVQAYIKNLNTHRAYRDLRSLRKQEYNTTGDVTGLNLTPGLLSYSERGQAYVNELNAMLRDNAALIETARQEITLAP